MLYSYAHAASLYDPFLLLSPQTSIVTFSFPIKAIFFHSPYLRSDIPIYTIHDVITLYILFINLILTLIMIFIFSRKV